MFHLLCAALHIWHKHYRNYVPKWTHNKYTGWIMNVLGAKEKPLLGLSALHNRPHQLKQEELQGCLWSKLPNIQPIIVL